MVFIIFLIMVILISVILMRIIFKNLCRIPESEQWIIQNGMSKVIWDPGVRLLLPSQRIVQKITAEELTLEVEPQSMTTKDNATIEIGSVISYRIVDAHKYADIVDNFSQSLSMMAISFVRSALSELDRNEYRSKSRQFIQSVTDELKDATKIWGIEITHFDIK